MGSELIYRGHDAQPAPDTYSPKPDKPLLWLSRPIRYMLREQRLLCVLVGIVITTVFFSILPSKPGTAALGGSGSGYSFDPVPYSSLNRLEEYQHRAAYHHPMLSSGAGKVPLGLKRKGLRIVVTGGAGFVGSHLVDRLMQRGDSVIVVDNFFTGRKENVMHHFGNPRFELIRHDVVEPLLLEVDQIYHLACPASPVHYKFNPVKTIISFS
ncbi:hypothetical protein CDL15_Pgr018508 [Punica granatum]|uniref:NAD-dependent epimerase/dehydratase domain-containing protein n=1 Tax=Punica granatum TaxID=22663 RepID=A0A218WZJ9_PUNGR|nr:hypothetical protein CDL15_Pgr018508 [Punica granatum]PKI73007.1 hypothetical protein CRG98_006610 [Punica granatum]